MGEARSRGDPVITTVVSKDAAEKTASPEKVWQIYTSFWRARQVGRDTDDAAPTRSGAI